MEDMLKDVLIKDSAGLDKVFIVDNLPARLLYRKAKRMMIDYTDSMNRQLLVPAFEVTEKGTKRQTNELVDELLPGIERSDNGDGSYVFNTDYNESRNALNAIDRYIASAVPAVERIPERVNYAAQPGNPNSAPLARHLIPRVVLPELVSPPALAAAQVQPTLALSEGHIPQAPANRQITDADTAMKERMAKARAARKSKKDDVK